MANISFTFSGRQNHAIDEKGRLILPNQFREVLCASCVKDRVYLGCYPGTKFVNVYPHERWLELVDHWKDEKRFPSTAVMNEGQRLFFSNVEPVNVDRTGRVTIPSHFRERAALKTEVLVIGVGEKMEIWNPAAHAAGEEEAIQRWGQNMLDEAHRTAANPQEEARLPQY